MPKIVKETLETVSDNVQNLGIENEALDPNGNLYLNFFLCKGSLISEGILTWKPIPKKMLLPTKGAKSLP